MLKTLLVDDEPLARDELRELLAAHGDFDIVGECGNAIEAIAFIHRQQPDVVFLDIRMPRISGLEMLAMLDPDKMPRVVFVTAFDDFAIQAFEEHAFDYLLKPVDPQRLAKTLVRLRRETAPQPLDILRRLSPLELVPCHGVNRIVLLPLAEVEYVSSRVSGVFVQAGDGREHFTELTLRTFEERSALFRCHRQHLVNLRAIHEIRLGENGVADIVTHAGRSLPVSRRFLKPLKEALGIPG
ncbi:two-component system response regulator BtsR [Chromobacterium violaceum]|uniref:two-component system response regulator BtsR n=1 Tax=Chromobacterium violaceum TaxID=536 RepID=UPI0005BBB419|nr:two-component system response regulator BtsR [Chromobacterium violaceum]ATP28295.1 two-component system response regulator YehT [Chromobacterium violaceum]ATP32204.1 two-component system response regulator YehT [Chromobacterium violaceum]KJH68668.1 two-component response-regulatory protein YehT [Chromobacterium violaceum]MBP4046160.1 two-component system response regulator BtsR [Chromobacterium violaceum]MCD0490966.1 two-component system response regulator BtsR [Chromobacterium violaceum]